MKHVKRVLALLLAMSMLLTMAVFAEEVADVLPTPETETEAPAEESTETPEEESTEAPAEESTEVPEGETTDAPAEESTEVPAEESTEAPEDESTEAPEDESAEVPEDESAEAPKGEATDAPEDESTEAPEGEATDAPEDESTEAPEDAPATDAEDAPAGDEAPTEDEADADGEAQAGFGYTVSFENGVLVLNRIRTDCKHDGEREKGTDKNLVGVTLLDEKQHKITYQTYDYERCTLCGLYISYVVGAVEETAEDHVWSNGHCSICYHYCTHTITNWVADDYTWEVYRKLNSKQCQLFTEQRYSGTCDICGYEDSEYRYTPNGEPADHVFDADGRCTNCYYNPAEDYDGGGAECPDHPEGHDFEEYERYIRSYEGTFTPKDDKVHIVKDYVLEITYLCKNCGVTKTEEELHFGEEIEEEHNIYDGVCSRCGYIAPECTHPNARFSYSSFEADLGVEAVQSNGDGTHTGKWIQSNRYYCPDCGQNFTVNSIMEGIYPCNFDYDTNTCKVCGYECLHLNARIEVYERAPVAWNDDEMQNTTVVDDGNGRTHTWNCYYREKSINCPTCGYYIEESAERVDAPYTEYHDVYYDDNPDLTCEACGAKPSVFACKHDITTTTRERVGSSLIPKDADSHYVTYVSVTTCDKCGYTLSRTDLDKREEPHEWNNYGVCYDCGYVCKHEGYDTTTVNDVFVATEKWTSVDKDSHTRKGRYETQVQCTHCGAAVSRTVTQADASVTVAHTFDIGVCRYCGYTCDHVGYEQTESVSLYLSSDDLFEDEEGYTYSYIDYTPEGSSGHSYTCLKSTAMVCEHCGAEFDITFDPNWKETEAHTFKDGVCTLCGYEPDLIQDAAPEDTVHDSDLAGWTVNSDGLYDHSTPQTIVTITLKEDGWVEWNINLIGGGNYGSGRKFLKAGESFDITWTGTDEQHYHPEGLATFNVDITVTTSDGQVTQSWSTDYQMNYTHSSEQDVPTQTTGNNAGNNGSTNSDMPKTGEREVSAATWLLLAACAFVGLLLVRKLRRD